MDIIMPADVRFVVAIEHEGTDREQYVRAVEHRIEYACASCGHMYFEWSRSQTPTARSCECGAVWGAAAPIANNREHEGSTCKPSPNCGCSDYADCDTAAELRDTIDRLLEDADEEGARSAIEVADLRRQIGAARALAEDTLLVWIIREGLRKKMGQEGR